MNPSLIAIIGLGIGAYIYARRPHHSAKASPTAPAGQKPPSSPTPPVVADHIDIAVPAPVPPSATPAQSPNLGNTGLPKIGGDPKEKLERPAAAGQSNYALYMESLQHINAVITSKWAAAGCK